jgi:hypothetical protein
MHTLGKRNISCPSQNLKTKFFSCPICSLDATLTELFQLHEKTASRFNSVNIRIYKTVILPVILYGCETWSLALREEHRLGVFENRVLRRIFGPKRDEVTGEWRNCIMKSFMICTLCRVLLE